MSNIDWRAFWTSVGTIVLSLIIYAIFIEPLVRVYKIQIVQPDGKDDKEPEIKKVA